MHAPCPICDEPGGFHDLDLHRARVQIPVGKLLAPGWQKTDKAGVQADT